MSHNIYVPPTSGSVPLSTGTTSLADLIARVRQRLGDTKQHHHQNESGDGVRVDFRLTYPPVESLTVTVSAVAKTEGGDYTVDADMGWVSFVTAPADSAAIVFSYDYRVWSDAHITQAINDSVAELFGSFYVEGSHDDIATTGRQEYTLQDAGHVNLPPSARIVAVEYWSDPHWVRMDGWSVRQTSSTKVLHFESAPCAGYTLRVTFQSWPGSFSSTGDSLEVAVGLPTRASEPIVLLAMSRLLGDRLGYRLRSDMGHNTQNENQIKSYEIQNDAAWYRSQAELVARKVRMDPPHSRVVY